MIQKYGEGIFGCHIWYWIRFGKQRRKEWNFQILGRKTVQTSSVLALKWSGEPRFIVLISYSGGINKSLDHERKYSTKGHEKESTHLDCK